MQTQSTYLRIAVVATFILLPSTFILSQGPLTPPGAPAPTMKALDQVEPRTIVNATNTPGNAGNVFRITAPGSYYLTGNVTGVSGKSGIEIDSHNVTLDLNGFTVQGVSGSGHGIRTPDFDYNNIVIRNGFVKGFGANGIDLTGDGYVDGALIEGVHCTGNGVNGFRIGGAVLRACTATANGGRGIIVDLGGCVITECHAGFNGEDGIATSLSSVVTACVAQNNGAAGISVNDGSVLKASAAYENGGVGIFAGQGSSVSECVARNNVSHGIFAGNDCRIVGNTCSFNSAGINAVGQNALIEGNLLGQNAAGLDVDAANNVIRGNTVRLNTDNYAIVAGNQVEILLSQIPETIDFPAKVILAGNVTAGAGGTGIFINSDNVTIDLAGHALIGIGVNDGISVNGSRSNISVRNGTIRNWGSDGIDASTATGGQFFDLIVHNSGGVGLKTGTRAQVRQVISRANTSSGITTSTLSVVADCTSEGNAAFGISVGTGSTVERCVVSTNTSGGIQVGTASTVVGNSCDLHASAAGIRVIGDRNRIDGNNLTRNSIGLEAIAGATGNTIIRNSALGNTTSAYSIVAGNDVGPIGAASAATNPFANISF